MAYPEVVEMHKLYRNMAKFYWQANDRSKAIDAQQKAIDVLKRKRGFSVTELSAFEYQLQKYQNK